MRRLYAVYCTSAFRSPAEEGGAVVIVDAESLADALTAARHGRAAREGVGTTWAIASEINRAAVRDALGLVEPPADPTPAGKAAADPAADPGTVSAPFYSKAMRLLGKQHGERLFRCDDVTAQNALAEALGAAERVWKTLAPIPSAKAKDAVSPPAPTPA